MFQISFFTPPCLTVYVASANPLKIDAVRQGLTQALPTLAFEFIGIEAPSGQAEQPMDAETLAGAMHRANDVTARYPQANWVIAIESGLFTQADGNYIDKAVIYALAADGRNFTVESEAVAFPKEHVEEARRRGFQQTTVGQVMQEKGLIRNHKDPHQDLIGISRMELIQRAIINMANQWPKEECSAEPPQQLCC